MKIIPVSNDQLEVNESGLSSVITGVILGLVGAATSLLPLFSSEVVWWISLIGVGIVLIAGLLIFSATSKHIVLNRTGISTVTSAKVIGGKSQTSNFDATQVSSIDLETHTEYQRGASSNGSNMPQRERVSTLSLTLQDNSQVLIATNRIGRSGLSVGGINVSSFGAAPLSEEANQLAAFFNVPLKSQRQDAIGYGGPSQSPPSPPSSLS